MAVNEYLSRTPTTIGNRKCWTLSFWVKRNAVAANQNPENTSGAFFNFYTTQGASPYQAVASFNGDATIQLGRNQGGADHQLNTTTKYRDVGNWMHLLIKWDVSNPVSQERLQLYVNGALENNVTGTYPSLNYNGAVNTAVQHTIATVIAGGVPYAPSGPSQQYFDWFFVDGQALTSEVFGFYKEGDGYISAGHLEATDFKPGQWSPRLPKSIKHTINRRGGFGVNGFYLPMNDSSNPGADFHCAPNSIIKLKGEDLPQPRNGAPTTSDAYVSELRPEVSTLGFDGVVAFDGNDDYLSIADNDDLDLGTGDFTIEFFAYARTSSANAGYIGKRHPSSFGVDNSWRIAYNDTNDNINLIHTDSGADFTEAAAPAPASNWAHYAFTRQSGTLRVFRNGVKTSEASGWTYNLSNSHDLLIGANVSSSFFLDGFLSNVRIIKGTALYTANFTAPTEPLTNVTNTVLLCCNSSTSTTAATVTPETITANNNPFATRNELTGSLILACPFVAGGFGQNGAENTTIPGLGDYHIALGGPSSIPAVNFLIASGNQAKITGDKGLYYGSSLDVSNSSINPRATVGTAFTPDGDYTVEFWAYQNDLTDAGGAHILQYDSDAGQTGWLISSDVGTFRWALRNSSNQDTQISTPNVVKSGQWNHFAGVYESSKNTMTAYLNGVAVGTTEVASNYLSTQYTNLNRIHIGSNTGNGSRPMLGYMQDLRIYKGVAKYKGGFDVSKPYTPVGIEPFRTSADTCKNNFATLNSLYLYGNTATSYSSNITLSDGNLTAGWTSGTGSNQHARSNFGMTSGKWYFETRMNSLSGGDVGIAFENHINDSIGFGSDQLGFSYRSDGQKQNSSSSGFGGAFVTGDILGCAYDADAGSIQFYRNGTSQGTAFTGISIDQPAFFGVGKASSGATMDASVNFGQSQTFGNRAAVNKNRVNNGTGNDVWHQSSNGGTHVDWTVSSGGTAMSVNVPSGNYARAWLLAGDGTIDPKKTYLLSFKYVTGPSNLGVQNDQGYMTAVDGSASPAGLSSGNYYSFIIQGTREVNFTVFTGSTYSLDEVVVSEIDECYTDTSGKGKFHYQPPTGFLALCEDNLPTPAIADPGDYFKAVLYTGSGIAGHSITGVGFKPDFVWLKGRTGSSLNHILCDIVRGPVKTLFTNNSLQQYADRGVISFDEDGFTLKGPSGDENNTNAPYVAWCWKAGGPAVINTEGNITTQVSANQTAGFSIVKSNGPGTSGHGLNSTPKFIIQKSLTAGNWNVAHHQLYEPGGTGKILLNLTNELADSSTTYMHSATATTFDPLFSAEQIAYVWAEVEGFSKFGSYIGNGTTDGPFVYCGFKPAWVLVKNIDTANSHWVLWDSSRTPYNEMQNALRPNSIDPETSGFQFDFLSNGFKVRDGELSVSEEDDKFIFAAFAESPFQTANAK